MKKEISVFLSDGFEEIEALTVVDFLRRAELSVRTISITGKKLVHGAHGIDVMADELFAENNYMQTDMIVLPGGMPGTMGLLAHQGLKEVLKNCYEEKRFIAAICAAPRILGEYGYLKGRKATSHRSVRQLLTGAVVLEQDVVVDDYIITSKGVGTAILFSLKLIELLVDDETFLSKFYTRNL